MSIAPMLLIKASAGTGKTYQLSSQFLELVLKGVLPDSILATTFTRKAAGEIRSRIFARLVQAVLQEESIDPAYSQNLHHRALEQLLSFHHRLTIGTLDSFFISLAKVFPFELGLPAAFSLLPEEERAEHWQEVLGVLLQQYSPTELIEILAEVSPDNFVTSIQNVAERLAPLYELHSRIAPDAWLQLEGGALCSDEVLARCIETVKREDFCPQTKSKEPNKYWLNAVQSLVKNLTAQDYKVLLEQGLTGAIFNQKESFQRAPFQDAHREALTPIVEHAKAKLLASYNKKTRGIKDFLSKLATARETILTQGSGWDFSEITRAVASVVRDEPLHSIFYRLDTRLHHVMLDEFQDTSVDQFRILQPFIEELASKADGTQASFFCVGDSKQAIYSWRGGDKKVFESIGAHWPHTAIKTMSICRRCRSAILDATNDIFLRLKALPELGAAGVAVSESFKAHESYEKDAPGEVIINKIAEIESEDEGAVSGDYILKDIVRKITDLHAKNYTDIAILTRDKKQIAECVQYLNLHGIKARDESSGVLITESKIVSLFIALLRFLDFPERNSLYLFYLQHSPLKDAISAYPSAEEFASALRQEIGKSGGSLEASLRGLLKYFDNEIIAGDECLAEFWSYVSSKNTKNRRFTDLAVILERVTIKPSYEGNTEAVRVMTIHASKGLEFDAVLLPFLNSKLFKVEQLYLKDEQGEIVQAYTAVPQKFIALAPEIQVMWEQRRDAETEEALNLLYVACTRAKYSLSMWCEPTKGDSITLGDVVLRTLTKERYGDLTVKKRTVSESGAPAVQKLAPKIFKPGERHRALSVLSPSKSSDQEYEIPESWKTRELSARYGTLFHAFLKELPWLENRPAATVFEALATKLDPEGTLNAGIFKRFETVIQSPAIAQLLSVSSYDKDAIVFSEKSFAVWSEEDKRLISGTFDRVVLHDDGKQVHIIDFKTDSEIKTSEELLARYRDQMALYKKSAAILFGLPARAIRTSLVLLSAPPLVADY